ncbi:SPAG8-like protein [Mya arenaria]|uniref:SPAG8-like protein n=1 Tax=Mya arenaria TaxID=6604 RepID=A0ABY7DUQ9_MYAAR|nr:SPAG8-like protein [Mya arenaria]
MSILNQGRNEIRFNNSDGRCLLENWVEERQVQNYDTVEDDKGQSNAQLFRDGHVGILTIDTNAKPVSESTVKASFKTPVHPGVPLEGMSTFVQTELVFKSLNCLIYIQQVFRDDINPPEPEPLDYKSVTAKDFNKDDFKHVPPKPTKNHNYRTEQPVTRNDAFSQPIDEYFDDTQPYDQENYPKM